MSPASTASDVVGGFCIMGGSIVEEYRFALALEDDVPLQRGLVAADALGNQRFAPVGGNEFQHRVLRVGGIVGKVDARNQVFQDTPHEYRYVDMRRLQRSIRRRYTARLDRGELERAVIAGWDAAEALKARL